MAWVWVEEERETQLLRELEGKLEKAVDLLEAIDDLLLKLGASKTRGEFHKALEIVRDILWRVQRVRGK